MRHRFVTLYCFATLLARAASKSVPQFCLLVCARTQLRYLFVQVNILVLLSSVRHAQWHCLFVQTLLEDTFID
ncbi:hypothetical protein BJY52DRAFT_1290617 [Lactarius psammicola]|nr:hypothetical protein BJY52DRAFT_1290617 [Lactarius psammicola]